MTPYPRDYPLIDDTPSDAYGPEYWLKQIRQDFEALIEVAGYDFASQEVAEIDLCLRPARYRNHV
jgi:hypothetical protein